jgi:hypothetical protein
MLKKHGLLLIAFVLLSHFASAQYGDDVNDNRMKDTVIEDSELVPFFSATKLQPGAEFMLTASTGAVYGELSPFLAFKPKEFFMAGAGIHGSFLNFNRNTFTYYGAYAFGRLTIAQQFFLNYEYRLLNGVLPNSIVRRGWVSSPIISIGFLYGPSYVTFGYASDVAFQEINPMGSFVYRLGFYF